MEGDDAWTDRDAGGEFKTWLTLEGGMAVRVQTTWGLGL